ncbi:putative succinate dehydrogenase [ubiquinone] iron-sulfur subunit 3, mitochondrial-like [Capsicum annuum]|nr:putative succinate dehydrogenase [ubiquinone] iron-sulfur subunit 3, mitochondrial-like [Capsicum annuum]
MGLSPKCVYFNLDGAVEFDNILKGNMGKTTKQGHFSIVVEFTTAEPEPKPEPEPEPGTDGHKKSGRKKWEIFGSIVGGFVTLIILVLLIDCLKKYDKQKKIDRMEQEAERGVPLLMTRVRSSKAPIASETHSSARSSLDSLLQRYAFRELTWQRIRTGVPYDAYVPSNLMGIKVSAMILKRHTLKRRVHGYYKEFFIPSGIIVEPYVEKLVLVYQNLGNWSSFYDPLPGYIYLTPVLGILAYDADDLYATNLLELDILALEDPINIRFPFVQPTPEGSFPKCVYFYSNNLVQFGHVTDGNICETRIHGHYSIVADMKAVPSPSPSAHEIAPSPPPTADDNNHQNINSKMWTISSVFLFFVLMGILFFIVKKYGLLEIKQRLYDSAAVVQPLLGNTKVQLEAPTTPLPENDYVL